jgi:tRNA/tmRNA/rRNA uracil-C5-methylase (TrmA/RlmC/RlmD family)
MHSLDNFYKKHLQEKTERMNFQLAEADLSPLCNKIVPTHISDGYRNRAKFRLFRDCNSLNIEGTDPQAGSVSFEDSLWILPVWGGQIVQNVVAFIQENHKDFIVDGFEIQLAHGKKNAHITFSVKRSIADSYEDFSSALLKKIREIVGVAIPSQKLEVGNVYLEHSIGEKTFWAHYASFFQSNLHLTPKLLDHVCQMGNRIAFRDIFDFYCGVGLLSLSLGKKDTKIFGVEANWKAVQSAQKNAKNMGFNSASFSMSSVERFVQFAEIENNNLVLINPPRSGCSPAIVNAIAHHNPNYVLLISCSLKSHVFDLAEWKKCAYEVISLKAFDMFPFTDFLETVTVLERKD